MRLPRPRFTIRMLMIAVAVAGAAFGGLEARRRYRSIVALSESYSRTARMYSETVDQVLRDASCWDRIPSEKKKIPDPYPFYTLDDAVDHARNSREKARRYRALASKYERSARSPWLSVEPDPRVN